MSPERAIRPITPEPGTTGRSSSSRTTVSPSTCTVGPLRMAVLSLEMTVSPLLPDSEEPMASVIRMLGRRAKKWSFTGAEKRAAEETTATSEERS